MYATEVDPSAVATSGRSSALREMSLRPATRPRSDPWPRWTQRREPPSRPASQVGLPDGRGTASAASASCNGTGSRGAVGRIGVRDRGTRWTTSWRMIGMVPSLHRGAAHGLFASGPYDNTVIISFRAHSEPAWCAGTHLVRNLLTWGFTERPAVCARICATNPPPRRETSSRHRGSAPPAS